MKNTANEAIKMSLHACAIVTLVIVNNYLFIQLSGLDFAYHKNLALSGFFAVSATVIELALIRVAMKKLKIKVVWE